MKSGDATTDVEDNREPAEEADAGSIKRGNDTPTVDLTATAAVEDTSGEVSTRPADGIGGQNEDEDEDGGENQDAKKLKVSFIWSSNTGKRKVEAEVTGEDTVGEEMIGKKMVLVKRQKKN